MVSNNFHKTEVPGTNEPVRPTSPAKSSAKSPAKKADVTIKVDDAYTDAVTKKIEPESKGEKELPKIKREWSLTGIVKSIFHKGKDDHPRRDAEVSPDNIPFGYDPSPLATLHQKGHEFFGKDILASYAQVDFKSLNEVVRHIWPEETHGGPTSDLKLSEIKARIQNIKEWASIEKWDFDKLYETRIGKDLLEACKQKSKQLVDTPEVLFLVALRDPNITTDILDKFIIDPSVDHIAGAMEESSVGLNCLKHDDYIEYVAAKEGKAADLSKTLDRIKLKASSEIRDNFVNQAEGKMLWQSLKTCEETIDAAIAKEKEATTQEPSSPKKDVS